MTTRFSVNEAVHEGPDSEKVIGFLNESRLKPGIVNLINNGSLMGIYKKNEETIALDIWNEEHEDILISSAEDISMDLSDPFPEESLNAFLYLAEKGSFLANSPFYEKLIDTSVDEHELDGETFVLELSNSMFATVIKDFSGGDEYVKIFSVTDIAEDIAKGSNWKFNHLQLDMMENHIDEDPNEGDKSTYEYRFDHVEIEISSNPESWTGLIASYDPD